MTIKHDPLLKEWMAREKAAVDYGRNCDKRISELEAYIRDLEKRLHNPTTMESVRPAQERQIEMLSKMIASLTDEIGQLRGQLKEALSLAQVPADDNHATKARLLKLEAVADMAQAGLTEELRIFKKPEPGLEDSILVTDGDDLIPPRWLPLKRALQALHTTVMPELKKARN